MQQGVNNSIANDGAGSEKNGIPNIFHGARGGINDMQGLHCSQNRKASESSAECWKLGGLIILARVIPARCSRATIRRARRRPALLRFLVLGMAGAAGAAATAAITLSLFGLFGLLVLLLFLASENNA
jgi:hypothetical protein